MKKNKLLSVAFVLALMITLIFPAGTPVYAASDSNTIDVSDTDSAQTLPGGVTYSGNVFTINTGATPTTVTVTGTTTTNMIAVAAGVSNLTLILDGVSITSPSGGSSPIDLQGDASVTLRLAAGTTNMLDAGGTAGQAGLRTSTGATVTIEGIGALTAKGSNGGSNDWGGAGIGGEPYGDGGTIIITSGTVNVYGGDGSLGSNQGAAGIGGGAYGDGGTITINGGTVNAYGGLNASGIGGGYSNDNTYGNGGNITISGGTVNACGGANASGIGGGAYGDGGTITISGSAMVTATASGYGGKPAIDASSGSTGSVINAKLNSAASASDSYLKCNGTVLTLPAYFECFAFSAASASVVGVYSDSGCTAQTHFIATTDATPSLNISVSSTIDAAPLAVQILPATLTVSGMVSGLTDNSGVTINYTVNDSGSLSTATDASGNFSFAVPTSANVVITPSVQSGYTSPSSITLNNVTSASTGNNLVYVSASTTIDVSNSSGTGLPTGVAYSVPGHLFTIGTGASNSTITVIGTTTTNTVAVTTGVSNLTLILNNVSITSSSGGNAPIDLQGNANVTLHLADGTTSTASAVNASQRAGIHTTSAASLTINGTGSLKAQGCSLPSNGGAGIGGHGGDITAGTIIINSGIINATGGSGCAGIGGGPSVAGGTITINGGQVTATGASTGIGGGVARSGGTINISGTAIVTATGANFGAGIGGGGTAGGDGGTISIGGTASVTAIGGNGLDNNGGGAGIGGGRGAAGGTITITGTPAIMASSYMGSSGKPAIDAAGGSGSIINAKLNTALSTSQTRYLACNGKKISLPANYQHFAFNATTASAVGAYSDSNLTILLGSIVTDPACAANIPVTDLSISPANITPVKLQTTYTATVTVNKDGGAWTSTTPDIRLSTSSASPTGAVTGSLSSGVYTFTGLNTASTYYVWDTVGNIYTGKSVTSAVTNAAVNYYTISLTNGTGIISTTGDGTYLGGSNVLIYAAVSSGFTWSGWTQTADGTPVVFSNMYTITSISSPIRYTANAAPNGPAPMIMTGSLPDGTVGTAYNQTLVAVTTAFPLTWSISGGSLPANLSLDPFAGTISGTPTTAGTSTFTVQAANPNGSVTKSLSITIESIYDLTVNLNGGNGSAAGGSYASGSAVSIDSGTKSGYTFSGWTSSNGGTFGDTSSASTTFTMPGNATTITANWTQNNNDGTGGGNSNSGGKVTPPANNNTTIIVDGKDYPIASEDNDEYGTTVTVDEGRLSDGIAKASDGSDVILKASANTNVTAQLVVKNIEDMAKKDMILTVQTGTVSYHLNTAAVDTAKILESLGTVDSRDIPFNVGIRSSNVSVSGTTVVVSPVEFTITATYGGKTFPVDTFNRFVDRTIEITADQAEKITTAVIVEPNGSLRHVPTRVTVVDGRYYAVINSLTNSIYTIIWHPYEFQDAANHWAKETINDMGSRMVVNGLGEGVYQPDRNMTRAEFAAIVVKALGLKPGEGGKTFRDVAATDWFNGYVGTAAGYGVVTGYTDGSFRPNDVITREQAMTMIARAMNITGLKPEIKDSEISGILRGYADGTVASDYAKTSVAACLKTGVITGRSSDTIAPGDNITRAEVAVIVQRLLKKSNLI